MLIQITRATVCGGEAREVGAIVDASDRDARVLIGMGKAVAADAGAIDAADSVSETPKRRGRPPKAPA